MKTLQTLCTTVVFIAILAIALNKLYKTFQQKETIVRYGIAFDFSTGRGMLTNTDTVARIVTKVWKKNRPVNGEFFNPQKILWTVTLQPNETKLVKNIASAGSGYYISSVIDTQKKYFVVPYDEM